MDDYEEGTWTPVVKATDGTVLTEGSSNDYSMYHASYTKIGNLVHCTLRVRDRRSVKQYLRVSLPFTSVDSDYMVGVSIGNNLTYGAGGIFMFNTGEVQLRENNNGNQYKYGSFTYRAV